MSKSVLRSILVVSISILGSRILGLIRDIVIASLFGAGALTDAFFVSFKIPNLLRRIFAEGAFSSAFTPAFSRKLKGSTSEARGFAESFFSVLLISLTITVVAGEIGAPLIIKTVAPGISGKYFATSVVLLREMFPYIFLVSLVAFYGGILNGFEHFFAPAVSTALFNLAIIVSAVLLSKKLSIESLAVGVIVGGVSQVLLQLFFLKRYNFFVRPTFKITKDVKKTLRNIVPGIFGFAVRQFSMLIDTVLASFLRAGAISYLYYANRFVQLPLGMFGVGISQVLLPRLSKRSNEETEHRKELINGILLSSAITIPASFGLIFFGKPIIDLVFNHGKFTESSLNATYGVLIGYSVGLYFYSLEKIVTNAYYSLDEYKFPVVVSAYTLTANLFMDLLLCFVLGWGVVGLALGTSLTSFLNVSILMRGLRKKFKIEISGMIIRKIINYIIYSIPIAAVSIAGTSIYSSVNCFPLKIIVVTFTILMAAAVYMVILFAVKDKFIEIVKF